MSRSHIDLHPGDVVDLTVRFGSQSRTQCLRCKRYLSVDDGGVGTCLCCHTTFGRQPTGMFSVVSLSKGVGS